MSLKPNTPIEFMDLKAQQARIRPQLDAAIAKVLDHGVYIMGPEVSELEERLAAFCGAKHVISCANGTDALGLGLMALDVKVGDAVFVPAFTFAATAEVVAWVGATAIFVDSLPDTYNMDPASLEQAIARAKELGLKPVGIIPVDIFGQPAEYDILEQIAKANGLWIMADGAQSFGGTYKGRSVGAIGTLATTSFFPAKPLGCYGDGGAVFTNDDALAAIMKSLRVHGQGSDKYDNVRVGMNGRLDTLQAAILIEKLSIFKDELKARLNVAQRYNDELTSVIQKPVLREDAPSAWQLYTVVLPEKVDRTRLVEQLKNDGIPTFIYYTRSLHRQSAYKHYPTATGEGLPVCERLESRVLSLPMHPYLSSEQQGYIIETFNHLVETMLAKDAA